MPKAVPRVKPKRKTKEKKTTSFGQFDMGRGSKAASQKAHRTKDPRTITGKKVSRKKLYG